MKTKPKKLSARARRKEMTGINLAALKKRIEQMERDILELQVLVKGQVFIWVDKTKGRKK